ncbi:MAG: transposase [Bacteroidales bacterium]|nr:transposase [Bacteroidales bacterium]
MKEREKIDRFLLFLEASGVGSIISKYVKNRSTKGGRPNCNYYRLFATILFGFAFDNYTLREIESACKFDLRYITLMEQTRIDYTTISKFINKVILPNEKDIFSLVCLQIKKEFEIDFDDAFIDGTKYEANCNKYKFVWKPTTFHEKISVKAYELIFKYNLLSSNKTESLIRSSTIATAITNLQAKKNEIILTDFDNTYKALTSILTKVLEYETKEEICGENRKSYYKTDHDATAMALKADYYAGLGTHMHAAYNVQALVIRGIVFSYYISQSRTDYDDFIPVLEAFYQNYNVYPKRVCADAGYGVLKNYKFLKDNNIENYVKNQSWEGNVSGSYPDSYTINSDDTITCLNGLIGEAIKIENRHPKKSNAVFFRIDGCNNCSFKSFCKRYMHNQDDDFKIFEVNKEFQHLKLEAWNNLLSPKGIEIRVNRSIQVEGVFGIIKQDYGRTRFNRRGMERVKTETMLYFLGLNIAKLFRYYETGKLNKFWIAPDDLEPQTMKKVSAKRLSKKGSKQRDKQFQS